MEIDGEKRCGIDLTEANYHSADANRAYWSVSLYKAFEKCEAAGLAQVRGEFEPEQTTALLVGSYVDAYFSGMLPTFIAEHPEILKRDGQLKAEYVKAAEVIERIEQEPLMMEFLSGNKQTIMTAELFGVPWKIKMDAYDGKRITDLKVMKDMEPIYEEGFGKRHFISYYRYDIQGAIYQKVEQIASGRSKPLPFYLAVATKEKEPNVEVIQISQGALDTALKVVEAKIERFDLIKSADVEPRRCEKCAWCNRTKRLIKPVVFEGEEIDA